MDVEGGNAQWKPTVIAITPQPQNDEFDQGIRKNPFDVKPWRPKPQNDEFESEILWKTDGLGAWELQPSK